MNIYIIAANVSVQLAKIGGDGLIANVGETTRNVRKRLKDEDYRRKTPGGGWKVIHEFVNVSVRDTQIHAFLKSHPRVRWNNNSNTEEFTFLDDDGSGSEAIKIVTSFLETLDYKTLKYSHSMLQRKYNTLLAENNRLKEVNEKFENSDIHKLIWEVDSEKKRANHAVSSWESALNQFSQERKRYEAETSQLKAKQKELTCSLSEMELSKKRKNKFVYLLSAALFGSLAYTFLSEEEKEVVYRPMVKYVEKVEQPPVVEPPKPEKKVEAKLQIDQCQLESLKRIGRDPARYKTFPQAAFDKVFAPCPSKPEKKVTAKPKVKKKAQVVKSVKSEKTSALAPKKTTTREQVLRDIKQSQSCGKYDMRFEQIIGALYVYKTHRPVTSYGDKVKVICYRKRTTTDCAFYTLGHRKKLSEGISQNVLDDVTCAWNKR
jgi:hypothetical protein